MLTLLQHNYKTERARSMANGMEMMLKSMGIDVSAIKEIVNPETVREIVDTMLTVKSKLETIDTRLMRIEMKLDTIPNDEAMKLLIDGKDTAELETIEYVRKNSDGNSNN